jgi:hypothetical protein
MNGSVLNRTARTARTRVESALKDNVERELAMAGDFQTDMATHSKFEHVTQPISNLSAADREDESLARSMWGTDHADERVRVFAQRLASLRTQ